MRIYQKVAENAPQSAGHRTLVEYLNRVLPDIFASQYHARGGDLLTVTQGGNPGENGTVHTMFDLRSKGSNIEDRVVGVWGLSKAEPANTRDTAALPPYCDALWSY